MSSMEMVEHEQAGRGLLRLLARQPEPVGARNMSSFSSPRISTSPYPLLSTKPLTENGCHAGRSWVCQPNGAE